MHIPDGFLSPQTYLPAYALASVAWFVAAKNLRGQLTDSSVPRLAMLTALSYALGLIMLPLPGGSSAHLMGVALLAQVFGVRLAFLSYSLVLLMQSLLFGAGGITALAVNALAIGGIGAISASFLRGLLSRFGDNFAVFVATWCSVMMSAACIALALGIQPFIAQSASGAPLFFPFDYQITLPAILLPHAILGGVEAFLTVFVWRYGKLRGWEMQAFKNTQKAENKGDLVDNFSAKDAPIQAEINPLLVQKLP